ncbi:hypothetical protein, partial [Nocardia beijingensis]|uniref:hypothetical protein n=1 Tax=Nocardia beijingensis TaxID=95162 RepID=UPI003980E01D
TVVPAASVRPPPPCPHSIRPIPPSKLHDNPHPGTEDPNANSAFRYAANTTSGIPNAPPTAGNENSCTGTTPPNGATPGVTARNRRGPSAATGNNPTTRDCALSAAANT